MTNSKMIGAGVLVVVGLVAITAGSIALPSLSHSENTYQYKIEQIAGSEFEKVFNDVAKDGWEYVGTAYNGAYFIFKKK